MAEFYQEILMVKAEIKGREKELSGLQEWRRCLVKFVAVKSKSGYLRMNFCTSLPNHSYSKSFASVLINSSKQIQLKRAFTLSSNQPSFILCAIWRNSKGEKCKVSFGFKNKMTFEVHKRIMRLFIHTLDEYRKTLTPETVRENALNSRRVQIRDLMETDDDDYSGRNGDDLSSLEFDDVSEDDGYLDSEDDQQTFHNHRIQIYKKKRKEKCERKIGPKQWSVRRFLLGFAKL